MSKNDLADFEPIVRAANDAFVKGPNMKEWYFALHFTSIANEEEMKREWRRACLVSMFRALLGEKPAQEDDVTTANILDRILWAALIEGQGDEEKAWATFQEKAKALRLGVGVVDTGIRTRVGMRKGLFSQWGNTEARLGKVRAFWEKHRKEHPGFGINDMKRAAVKACGVSMTFINDYRREGRLVIPPKS